MDLIKNYGSYENAKAELEKIKSTKYRNYMYLEEALFEYRRANNIFEMDDYIIHDGELKVFAMWSTTIEGCAYIGYAYAEDGEMADKSEFRHATDAEIQAGHKL